MICQETNPCEECLIEIARKMYESYTTISIEYAYDAMRLISIYHDVSFIYS